MTTPVKEKPTGVDGMLNGHHLSTMCFDSILLGD